VIVHLPLIRSPKGCHGSRLQPEHNAAHARTRLPLLPPGPDGIHAPGIAQGPTINTTYRSTSSNNQTAGGNSTPL